MNQRRSRLEQKFEYILNDLNIPYTYETTVIPYVIPESQHKYTVDWSFPHNNIHIESKGYLSDNTERQKYILIKKQNPDLDLRFVFLDEHKLCGGMKTTHGEWAKKHGFPYCSIKDYDIIKEWLDETSSNT